MGYDGYRTQLTVCAVALVICLTGCGKTPESYPARQPVSGTVTYNDKPVDGATVVFVPKKQGPSGIATTAADGTFSVTMYEKDDGLLAGEYVMTVTKRDYTEPAASDEAIQPNGTAVPGNADPNAPWSKPPKDLLPVQYGNSATSGLGVEVGNEPIEGLVIELTD